MKGYFAIGVYQPKTIENIGSLWRSAYNFGAQYIFTIGRRYKKQASDTTKTWMKIPLFEYKTWEEFENSRPLDCVIVGIEQSDRSRDLDGYGHLPRSIYVLGSEDNGLPLILQDRCNSIVHISTPMCLNVAVAGSIVMYSHTKTHPTPTNTIEEKLLSLQHKFRSFRKRIYGKQKESV